MIGVRVGRPGSARSPDCFTTQSRTASSASSRDAPVKTDLGRSVGRLLACRAQGCELDPQPRTSAMLVEVSAAHRRRPSTRDIKPEEPCFKVSALIKEPSRKQNDPEYCNATQLIALFFFPFHRCFAEKSCRREGKKALMPERSPAHYTGTADDNITFKTNT